MQVQHFLHTESRKRFLLVIPLPHCIKARELEMGTCCPKNILASHDVHPNRIKDGRGHKASDKTPPDQVIKLKLFGCQMRLDYLRRQCNISRANRFVSILSGRFGFPCPSLSNIEPTIFLCDILFYFRLRFIRNAGGVRTHIRNQSLMPLCAQLDPLIELLGKTHLSLLLSILYRQHPVTQPEWYLPVPEKRFLCGLFPLLISSCHFVRQAELLFAPRLQLCSPHCSNRRCL